MDLPCSEGCALLSLPTDLLIAVFFALQNNEGNTALHTITTTSCVSKQFNTFITDHKQWILLGLTNVTCHYSKYDSGFQELTRTALTLNIKRLFKTYFKLIRNPHPLI